MKLTFESIVRFWTTFNALRCSETTDTASLRLGLTNGSKLLQAPTIYTALRAFFEGESCPKA